MSSQDTMIRVADESHLEALLALATRTFVDTYTDFNTPEDMQQYLKEHFSKAVIAREIQEGTSAYLVALQGPKLMGYVKLVHCRHPQCLNGKNSLELERIYVDPAAKGHGIGSKLIAACLAKARNDNYDSLWLGVWERNNDAISFYNNWGFVKRGNQDFLFGKDVQNDWVLEHNLGKEA